MEAKVSNSRVWLWRLLVVLGAALMVYAWFQPWWTIDIEGFGDKIAEIRPWGLVMDERVGGFAILLKGTEMPAWFAPFMWVFLGLLALALLVALFVGGKDILKIGGTGFSLSEVLVAGVGIACIVCVVVAAVYASARMKETFNVPLQGRAFIDMGEPIIAWVDTYLLPGFYMMGAAGVILLVLGLGRREITGEA